MLNGSSSNEPPLLSVAVMVISEYVISKSSVLGVPFNSPVSVLSDAQSGVLTMLYVIS